MKKFSDNMKRRKIGSVIVKNDDGLTVTMKNIWGNVWEYNSKIWFGLFFNSDVNTISLFKQDLKTSGFIIQKIENIFTTYNKYELIATKELFQSYIDTLNNTKYENSIHTNNGIITYYIYFKINKNADYIFDEKVLDSI